MWSKCDVFFLEKQKLYCKEQKMAAQPKTQLKVQVLYSGNSIDTLEFIGLMVALMCGDVKKTDGSFFLVWNTSSSVGVLRDLTTLFLKDESMRKQDI